MTLSDSKMVILGDGNVGIGTISPDEKLEVDGNIKFTDFSDDLQFGSTANTFSYNQWKASASGGVGIYNSSSASTGHIYFQTSAGEKVRISRDGNVGVGVTSPQAKLDVSGGIRMADDTDAAAAAKVGTMRYRTGTEYVETTGVELITNGNFATDTNWTKGTGWSISGGTANGAATVDPLYQTITGFTAGSKYRVRFKVTAVTSGYIRVYAYVGASGTFTNILSTPSLTTGTYEGVFEFGGANKILRFYGSVASTGGFTGSIDNVLVTEVTEEDASYADMCMQTAASTYEWVNIVRNTY
jgi:hypothetical protein